MKKAFLFELKRYIVPLSIYFGIMTIIGFCVILPMNGLTATVFINLFSVFMFLLVIGIIYISFSYNKKRISADMTFSLPVTKKELFIGKYLASITAIFGLATIYLMICVALLGISYGLNNLTVWKSFGYQIGYFFKGISMTIVFILPLFNLLLLFYYKANTVLDGILFANIGLVLVYLVMHYFSRASSGYSFTYPIAVYFSAPFTIQQNNMDKMDIFTLTTYAILGYSISIYLIWYAKKDDSIRTQAICDGIFGYKVFYPLIGALLPFVVFSGDVIFNMIMFVLIWIGLFMGYCIYHRSPKFTKQSYIVLGATIGFDFVCLLGIILFYSLN